MYSAVCTKVAFVHIHGYKAKFLEKTYFDYYQNTMNALKCRTLGAMSSCHCGQTLLGGMTNGNSRNSTHDQLSSTQGEMTALVHYHVVNT